MHVITQTTSSFNQKEGFPVVTHATYASSRTIMVFWIREGFFSSSWRAYTYFSSIRREWLEETWLSTRSISSWRRLDRAKRPSVWRDFTRNWFGKAIDYTCLTWPWRQKGKKSRWLVNRKLSRDLDRTWIEDGIRQKSTNLKKHREGNWANIHGEERSK